MNNHAIVAAGITSLVLGNFHNKFLGNYDTLAFKPNTIFTSKNINQIYEVLKSYSLVELREYLYLLVPQASNMESMNLNLAIQYIEKDIDLTNKNECEQLKTQCEYLKNVIDEEGTTFKNYKIAAKLELENFKENALKDYRNSTKSEIEYYKETHLKNYKIKKESQLEYHIKENQELKNNIETKQEQITFLTNVNQQLDEENQQLIAETQQLDEEVQQLIDENQELKNNIKFKHQQITLLTNINQDLEINKEKVSTENKQLEEENLLWKKNVEIELEQIATLRKQNQDELTLIKNNVEFTTEVNGILTSQKLNFEHKIEELLDESKNKGNSILMLKLVNSSLSDQIKVFENDNEKTNSKLLLVEQNLNNIKNEFKTFKNDKEQMISKLENNIDYLESATQLCIDEKLKFEIANEQLKNELDIKVQTISKLENYIDYLEGVAQLDIDGFKDTNNKLLLVEQNLNNVKNEIITFKNEKVQLEITNEQLKNEKLKFEKDKNLLYAKCTELIVDIENLDADLHNKIKYVLNLENELVSWENKYNELKYSYDEKNQLLTIGNRQLEKDIEQIENEWANDVENEKVRASNFEKDNKLLFAKCKDLIDDIEKLNNELYNREKYMSVIKNELISGENKYNKLKLNLEEENQLLTSENFQTKYTISIINAQLSDLKNEIELLNIKNQELASYKNMFELAKSDLDAIKKLL